ncbi:hypothetical protein [Streptomyces sp. NPDC002845]
MKPSTARKLALATGAVALITAGFAWQAAASDTPSESPASPDSGTTSVKTGQDPSAVEEYWTPERMENAEPAPMPEDD